MKDPRPRLTAAREIARFRRAEKGPYARLLSLREVGNLSSASVLFVLGETLEGAQPQPGDWGVMMAMGPGFCAEMVLLRW